MSDDRMPGRDEEVRPGADAGSGREAGNDPHARELKADFETLRAELRSAHRVPDFHAMMERARQAAHEVDEPVVSMEAARSSQQARLDLMRLGRWIPVAAAAAVAGLFLFGGGESGGDDQFERLVADYSASAASWRSPTASLMDIPGVDLGAVPSFGTPLIDLDVPETTSEEGRDS